MTCSGLNWTIQRDFTCKTRQGGIIELAADCINSATVFSIHPEAVYIEGRDASSGHGMAFGTERPEMIPQRSKCTLLCAFWTAKGQTSFRRHA